MARHLCLVVVLTLFASFSSAKSVGRQELFKLPIVHFNDFHARFEETSVTSTKCMPENGECIGGFPRLYTAVNSLKTQNPDALVLNAGDSFQGTLWYNLFRWNVTQRFMNMLPLDVHTIGNHEFDHGIDGIVPYLKALKAPVVVSNIDDSLEPDIQKLYNKSIVIERNGRKIGIIGVIAENTDELANTEDLKFTDEATAVRNEAEILTQQGVDIIVVLSHCGLDVDRLIAKNGGPNIDIIVGGHSHSLLYTGQPPNGIAADVYPVVVQNPTNNVLIVQASAYTKYLGNITLYFDPQGKLISWEGSPIYLNDSIPEDKDMVNLLKPYKDEIDAIGLKQIGSSKVLLSKSRCSNGECNIGNFITDAFVESMVAHADNDSWTYAAICIINQGGIRTDINKGVITYEDLIISQPFENSLHTFDLKGKYIVEALEHAVNSTSSSLSFSSASMAQISGLQVVYNVTKPIGQRVDKVLVKCSKCDVPRYSSIEDETLYKLVVPSFIANGGDGFTSLSENKINVKIWGIDIDVLEKHLEKFSPIIVGEDNRIVILK